MSQFLQTRKEIEDWLRSHYISGATLRNDLTVDVIGDVAISYQGLTHIPVRFGVVSGLFNCARNKLSSLEGAPSEVGDDFYCTSNELKSLEHAPRKIGGHFYCGKNKLTSLEGAPAYVAGDFCCRDNWLASLSGAPMQIYGEFSCSGNQLASLEGSPHKVVEDFVCHDNPFTSFAGAPIRIGGSFAPELPDKNIRAHLKNLLLSGRDFYAFNLIGLCAELRAEIAMESMSDAMISASKSGHQEFVAKRKGVRT